MTKRNLLVVLAAAVLLATPLVAHPHFMKKVEASTRSPNMTAQVQHFTVPYNEEHLAQVEDGFVFHCGNATFSIVNGTLKVGDKVLEAGDYGLRARAKSVDDWTLLLVPFPPGADRQNPDMTTAIELPTTTSTGADAAHLGIDLHGGEGQTDGKMLISVSFGPRTVDGVLGL